MRDQQDNSVETTLCVRYAETDQMGVVYYANYLVWFEVARNAFCRARGIDYAAMEAQGLFLPILEARCRYRVPAHYNEEITIAAHVTERTKRTLKMAYRMTRGDVLIAEGETTQMLVDRAGRPTSFPPEIASRFDGDVG